MKCKFIDPIDIVILGGISDNPIDLVKRGIDYYKRQEEELDGESQSSTTPKTTTTSEVPTLQQTAGEA